MSPQPSPRRTVLLTGAAGRVGSHLRRLLPEYGYELRLTDLDPVEGDPGAIIADLGDPAAVREAVRGADAIVHLGGVPGETEVADIMRSNILGTYHVYEAARLEGVRRVVYASSNHAVGFTPLPGSSPHGDGALIPAATPHRPDTHYGLSKCYGEDLAQLYWDKHGIETVSVRIGSCFPEPRNVRMLALWLSPADCARLVDAALTASGVGHTVVYGSSANTRVPWDLSTARGLGYEPRDDSESYAAKLIAEQGEPDPGDRRQSRVGGPWVDAMPDA